jgi:hypothetical protein
MRSLQKQAEERFASATEMAEALAAARQPRAPRGDDLTVAIPAVSPPPDATMVLPGLGPPAGGRAARSRSRAGAVTGRRGDRRRAWWIAGLALALVALLALPLVVSSLRDERPPGSQGGGASPPTTTRGTGNGATLSNGVRVPALTGERLSVAVARLRALGLRFEVRSTPAPRDERGRVVSQDPPAGTGVERGTTVQVRIGGRETGKGRGNGGGNDNGGD